MKEVTKFKFEELKVYQKSLDFIDLVYDMSEHFPKTEKYILVSQYLRAANSIALNIAEGSGDSSKQFNRYLQIAIDSVRECVVCNTIAYRRDYIKDEQHQKARVKLVELAKMITGLQKYLKKKTTN